MRDAAVPCRARALHTVAAQRARFLVVLLDVERLAVFDGLARLLIDAVRPVQIVHVLLGVDELAVRPVERVVEAVAREMAHYLAHLAADVDVVEHLDADLVPIP